MQLRELGEGFDVLGNVLQLVEAPANAITQVEHVLPNKRAVWQAPSFLLVDKASIGTT